tara:strand:+ start:741 stop:1454 length:714 start_codon:yes stop_codon:yes gene_type:complete
MVSENIIVLKNVWKSYDMGKGYVHAVKNIDLEIKKGEFVAIVGPSGAGKSTMMNLVGCLDTPTKGQIYLKGVDVGKVDESKLAQLRGKTIGFVFQQFNLIPSLNSEENVFLPMSFQGIDRERGLNKSREILGDFGMNHREKHYPNELSGGERQRVAISRALANNPEVVLADEPTGNLDSKTGKQVMKILNKIHESGTTVILVTHDLHLVDHAERVVFIKDGIIEKIKRNNLKNKRRK